MSAKQMSVNQTSYWLDVCWVSGIYKSVHRSFVATKKRKTQVTTLV
jgi:hypothetical protein